MITIRLSSVEEIHDYMLFVSAVEFKEMFPSPDFALLMDCVCIGMFDEEGNPIGYTLSQVCNSLVDRGKIDAEVFVTYIDKEYRGKSLGRQLTNYTISFLKERFNIDYLYYKCRENCGMSSILSSIGYEMRDEVYRMKM